MLMLSKRHPRWDALLLWVAFSMLPAVLLAQASTYVPNLDPVYQDLDALVAEGLVREIILGERPYSRVDFARFAQEARRRIDTAGEEGIKARVLEA